MSTSNSHEPLIPASVRLPELTFKAILIAIILAVVLAAANAYLALKIGSTISASIPASILAIGILRFFKNHNVLECNIIQTAASAGEGIAAAIAYVLPAMIFIHAWEGFSYMETFMITTLGGLLGVAFSVPLRKILLELPTLKFPEGTAIGNVLKAATATGNQLKLLILGSSVGALVSFAQTGLKVIASDWQIWGTTTSGNILGFAFGFTPATLAAGFIVGIQVSMSLLVGIIINWLIILPIISPHIPVPHDTAYNNAMTIWSNNLRFIGVGTMLAGGVWTILRLLKPLITAITTSWNLLRQTGAVTAVPRTEKDIPITWVLIIILAMLVLSFVFIYNAFVDFSILSPKAYFLWMSLFSTFYILVIGFLLSTVCGYFTGLIGSTNNPLSGILLMSLILLGLIFCFAIHALHFGSTETSEINKLSAVLVLITGIIATSAAISNENIQDLKAGQMVGASPWKQQVMLGLGVIVSALTIGPVLNLLYQAYGIAGVFPHPGMDPSHMLPAPQASLIAAVASGVLTLHLQWDMIITGVIIGAIIIFADEILKNRGIRLPALAVGLGMYLPMEVNVPIIIGGIINHLAKLSYKRKKMSQEQRDASYQRGTLLASGLVAGGAIMGVLIAIPFVIAGNSDVLTIMPNVLTPLAVVLGFASLAGLGYWMYRQ